MAFQFSRKIRDVGGEMNCQREVAALIALDADCGDGWVCQQRRRMSILQCIQFLFCCHLSQVDVQRREHVFDVVGDGVRRRAGEQQAHRVVVVPLQDQ